MTSHTLANTYFPIEHDSVAPSCKLSTVIDHCFQTPRWQQGILVADSYINRAETLPLPAPYIFFYFFYSH